MNRKSTLYETVLETSDCVYYLQRLDIKHFGLDCKCGSGKGSKIIAKGEDIESYKISAQDRGSLTQTTHEHTFYCNTKYLESVFHQVGGNGKIEIKVNHESGELMADWPITVVTIYSKRASTFGLDKK